jgi:oleate hydratase
MTTNAKAYLIGGGIGSLAAAAFMVRDGDMPGRNISILEAGPVLGGSLDGAGNPTAGYSLRGGRMLTTDNYECTWDLFKTIPSLSNARKSVFDETVEFNELHKSHSMARLVDRRRARVPVSSMGFSMHNRVELLKLVEANEEALGASPITDWLSPSFFDTPFWAMWVTTFAFQPWHSAVELRRYLHRFMMEFSRIDTLAGVKRTIYNQYDSLVRPLQAWLQAHGVRMVTGCEVTGLDHKTEGDDLVVTAIRCLTQGKRETLAVSDGDLVVLQNGSMTDSSSLGSMTAAPAKLDKMSSRGWQLWEALAAGRPEFGRPAVFNSCVAQSCWESFTVTLMNPAFFDAMQAFSGNVAGTGGLVTFKDSNWLMSVVLAHQPHFLDQPADVQVFWGYALLPDRVGNFVAKPMDECSGAEILHELCGHLRFDLSMLASAKCIPCRMPYITSMEIADDVVFPVEYSVRAAQIAVYALLQVVRTIPPVTRHDRSIRVKFDVLIKAFA